MRLRLTLEYDGTGFRGWAAQPGLRTVEGVLQEALERCLRALVGAAGRGTNRHGRARARPGRLGRGRRRRADRARGAGAERQAARRRGRERGRAGARRTSTRATSLALAAIATGSTAVPSARRSRRGAPGGIRTRSTRSSSAESAELILGEHDFRAFTPTETQHKVFTRTVESAVWHRREEASRARDHGGLVPAPHGADARRHDGRAVAAGAAAAARGRPAQRRRHDGPARGASTWFPSATSSLGSKRWRRGRRRTFSSGSTSCASRSTTTSTATTCSTSRRSPTPSTTGSSTS